MFGKLAPETTANEAANFSSLANMALVRRCGGNQPAVYILFRYQRAESCELRRLRVFANRGMDDCKKARETRGAKPFEHQSRLRGFRRIQVNGQKQVAERLKF